MALAVVHVVGDSISSHYMEALPAALGSAAIVRGGGDWSSTDWSARAGSGCDSTQALAYLRATLPTDRPDVLLLNCGLHDIKCNIADGSHQVESVQYASNLAAIVELVLGPPPPGDAGAHPTKLVWVSTTPCDVGPDGTIRTAPVNQPGRAGSYGTGPFNRSNRTIAEYNSIAARVMAARGVPTLDLHAFTTKLGATYPDTGTYDSVHFIPEFRCARPAPPAPCFTPRLLMTPPHKALSHNRVRLTRPVLYPIAASKRPSWRGGSPTKATSKAWSESPARCFLRCPTQS
jgi:hypothetical protein